MILGSFLSRFPQRFISSATRAVPALFLFPLLLLGPAPVVAQEFFEKHALEAVQKEQTSVGQNVETPAGQDEPEVPVRRDRIISSQPYPVGNVELTREDLTSSSFILRLKNYNLMPEHSKTRMQTWMLAGIRGRTPTVHVQNSEFVYVKDGKETSSTATIPEQLRSNFARINDLGQMRQFWTYTLAANLTSAGSDGGAWVCKSATLLVDIGAAPGAVDEAAVQRFRADDGFVELAEGLLLNPDIHPSHYVLDYSDPVETWQAWSNKLQTVATDGNLFKFRIYAGGFYRLSAQDLRNIATDTSLNNPASKWRVYRGGQEIPVMADAADPEAAIYLPVPRRVNDGLWNETYWLDTSGADSDQAPLRYNFESAEAAAVSALPPQTTGTLSVLHRELKDYNPRLRSDKEHDRWYWTNLDAEAPARVEVTMPRHFNPAPQEKVTLLVTYGYSNVPPVPPTFIVSTTGHISAEAVLNQQVGKASLELPASALRPGKNELSLQIHYPLEASAKRPVSIQSIETRWVQKLAGSDRSSFTFETDARTTAPVQFQGELPENARLFALKDGAYAPLAASDNVYATEGPATTMLFANPAGATPITRLEQVKKPARFEDLRSGAALIIAAPELGSMEELAQLQKDRGLSVEAYDVTDLYDLFSFGDSSPAAISRALRYFFFRAEGTPPAYVTLVGEASEFQGDPDLGPPGVQPNMVPASAAERPDAIQGDHYYAASIGTDLVADFAIGRIPTGQVEQLAGYVQKMQKYQEGDAGDWSARTLFVMDDNEEFPEVVGDITRQTLSPLASNRLLRQWDYEYVNNLRVQGRKRSWQATQAVVDSFNEGLSILNFFGHGGPNLWSHERLFHLNDLKHLKNTPHLPLITCASCDNAWITYPMPPVNESMGELLVMMPQGGGIGLFGPVAGASPYEHLTLVQNLMESLLRVQLRRSGNAIFYAKNMYYATTRSSSIPEQYLLLGDPTVNIKIPVATPGLSGSATDVRVTTAGPTQMMVELRTEDGLVTSGTLEIRDAATNEVLGEKTTLPRQSAWMFVLPEGYAGGCIMARLQYPENGQARYLGGVIRVEPALHAAEAAVTRASIEGEGFDIRAGSRAAQPNNRLTFEVRPTTDATSSGTVEITALAAGKPLGMPTAFELTTGTQAYQSFTLPLPDDKSAEQIQIIASLRPAGVTVATFNLPKPDVAELEFVPDSVKAYSLSDRLIAGATVVLEAQIRNIGTAAARRVPIQALKDSPTTGTELVTNNDTTIETIPLINPGETVTVKFRWEQPSAGTHDNIYLVANRSRAAAEVAFQNNSILVPAFHVEHLGNFYVSKFDVSPPFVTMGTPVTITGTVNNTDPNAGHPVTVEVGWRRTFDSTTTFTRTRVELVNGAADISEQMIAPAGFSEVYLTVNADKEVEEVDTADNTTNTQSMMAYDLPDFQKAISLGDSLVWGKPYNAIMPFEAQLQVAGDLTSRTFYVLPQLDNVTSGNAEAADLPDDNAWSVAPWNLTAKASENPGPLSLRVPVAHIDRNVPGRVIGHIQPYQPHPVPLQVKWPGQADWITPIDRGSNTNLQLMDFGILPVEDQHITFDLQRTGPADLSLVFLSVHPQAMQWDSVPYQLPARLQHRDLMLAIDTRANQWEKVYLEWRSGNWANDAIAWGPWNSEENEWSTPFRASEFVQFRIIATPKPGMQPYLENFRITK